MNFDEFFIDCDSSLKENEIYEKIFLCSQSIKSRSITEEEKRMSSLFVYDLLVTHYKCLIKRYKEYFEETSKLFDSETIQAYKIKIKKHKKFDKLIEKGLKNECDLNTNADNEDLTFNDEEGIHVLPDDLIFSNAKNRTPEKELEYDENSPSNRISYLEENHEIAEKPSMQVWHPGLLFSKGASKNSKSDCDRHFEFLIEKKNLITSDLKDLWNSHMDFLKLAKTHILKLMEAKYYKNFKKMIDYRVTYSKKAKLESLFSNVDFDEEVTQCENQRKK